MGVNRNWNLCAMRAGIKVVRCVGMSANSVATFRKMMRSKSPVFVTLKVTEEEVKVIEKMRNERPAKAYACLLKIRNLLYSTVHNLEQEYEKYYSLDLEDDKEIEEGNEITDEIYKLRVRLMEML